VIVEIGPAFLVGLAGGAHCAVMCGGVASATCGRVGPSCPSTLPLRGGSLARAAAWNLGRIATYAACGAIVGLVGSASSSFVPFEALRFGLRAAAAIALVGIGLHLAGISRAFAAVEKLGQPLWKRVAPVATKLLPARTPLHAALLGAIWGFVPCGLVYAALTLAVSSGSAVAGAASMLAFGAGTLPVMTTLASLGGVLGRAFGRPNLRRVAGAVIVVLGAQQTALAYRAAGTALGGAHHACCPGGGR
jgi:uncharacterized protein